MKAGVVISLAIVVFFIYHYVIDSDTSPDDGGNDLQSRILEFLEYLGANLAGDLALKGIYKLIKAGIKKLRAKGVKTPSEKAGKVNPKEPPPKDERIGGATAEEEAIAKEQERIAQQEAERAAEEDAKRAAEAEAAKAGENAGEKAGENAGEKAGENAGEKAGEAAGEHAGENAGEKAGENAGEDILDKEIQAELDRVAKEEADKAAAIEAERLAKEAAEKAAAEAAKLAEEAAAKAAAEAAAKEAERLAAVEAARVAALSAKVEGMMSQLVEGPLGWALLAIETALYGILGLDPSMFKPCKEGEVDLANLPAWAQGLISAVPLIGDLFTLIGGLLCFRESCPEGTENSGGLCYPPCKEGFKSDGATICWKQYGDYWENKGFPAAPTITSITKTVLTNTGVPYSRCPEGMEQDGALCYPKCREGYDGVGPVCWARIHHNEWVGRIPDKKGCYDFQVAEGWKRSRDDGTSCWEDWGWSFDGCGCIKKALWDRQYCADGGDLIAGLCYSKCPEGMEHMPGAPYSCRTIGEISYGRTAGVPMICGEGQTEDSLGLCYNQPPPGFEKTTLGLMADKCPDGTTDFGVGCSRESYNRGVGKIGLSIYLKERDNYYGRTDAGSGYVPDLSGLVEEKITHSG